MSSTKNDQGLHADPAKEEQQENIFLLRIARALNGKPEDLEKAKAALEKRLFDQVPVNKDAPPTKEKKQELMFLDYINKNLITSSGLFKILGHEEIDIEKSHKTIDDLLRVYKQITVPRITELTGIDSDKVLSYLTTLESQGKVVQLEDRQEVVCSNCSSLNLEPLLQCPVCESVNHKISILIEHLSCTNVSSEETYVDGKCPKCSKQIKELGTDYNRIDEGFLCQDCEINFPEPKINLVCKKCNTKSSISEADSKETKLYKLL